MEPSIEIKKSAALRNEVREKTAGYILTALGLVAGLAWNDAISSAIKVFFPLDTNGILVKFIYAIIMTIAIVMISKSLLKVLGPKEC
jgi:hypothetical protein